LKWYIIVPVSYKGLTAPTEPGQDGSLYFQLKKDLPLISVKSKGKAIPLQALIGPEGSRRLRLPDVKTIGTSRWLGCQPYAPAAFTPRKFSWYSFQLEAESTPRAIVRPEELYQ
jgi:hypothetical protein